MTGNPIELHVDLDVDPSKERNLAETFHSVFAPTIGRQPGFVAVKLLKGRDTASYRLVIGFQSEEQRVAWVATADHQRVWPQVESNLQGAKFAARLWDTL